MGLLDIINPSPKTIKESYERLKLKEQGLEEPSLLGAIRDPQFRSDVVRGLLDAGNRGAVAGTIGAPVDLATMVMRLGGYNVDKPVMGSEWIGDKMRQAGFVSDNRNPVAEALAGVALPAAGAKLAPKVFAAEQAAIKNAQAPRLLNGPMQNQAGAIGPFHSDVLASMSKGIPDDVASAAFGHDGFVYHTPYRPFENSQAKAIGGGTPIAERVFSTQKPLTAAQLKSIEALPVSEGATNAFARELADEGAMGFLNKDGKRFSVVTPSAKNQGQYQATQYDPRGAIGDSQHQTSADAIRRLIDGGYSKILDERRIEGLLSKVMLAD